MSYNTELAGNNAALRAILGQAQSLPDKDTGGGGGGLAYDMGEFVLDADGLSSVNGASQIRVPHNLGATPCFVLVWTDDYAGVTNPDTTYSTNLGFIWLKNIMGMQNNLSSVVKGEGTTVNFILPKEGTDITVSKPNAASYIFTSAMADAESFALVRIANSSYWRAGITYKYFVSRAWWNMEVTA